MFSEKWVDFYVITDQLGIFSVIPVVKQWALSFDSRKLIQKLLKDNNETLSFLTSPTKACLPGLPDSGGILYAQKSS